MARLTKEQRAAAKAWNCAVDAEERYRASVFVEPVGLAKRVAETAAAHAECVHLGIFEADPLPSVER